MKGLFKSSLLVVIALLKLANAIPIPEAAGLAQAGATSIEQQAIKYDYPRGLVDLERRQPRILLDFERRDLEADVQPVLQAAQPLADGVDQGATNLGYHAA